jgi:hypothetical protein
VTEGEQGEVEDGGEEEEEDGDECAEEEGAGGSGAGWECEGK